jgi:hypothetical protein
MRPAKRPSPPAALAYRARRFDALGDGPEKDALALDLLPYEIAKPRAVAPPPPAIDLGPPSDFSLDKAAEASLRITTAVAAGLMPHDHGARLAALIEGVVKMKWAADINRAGELRDRLQALVDELGTMAAGDDAPKLGWGRFGPSWDASEVVEAGQAVEIADSLPAAMPPVIPGTENW